MKKLVLSDMDILYKGEVIHSDLTPEKCSEILQELAFQYYSSNETEYDPKYIEVKNLME